MKIQFISDNHCTFENAKIRLKRDVSFGIGFF
jgi:hypothetical protein